MPESNTSTSTLGVTLHDGKGTIRVYSANATSIEFLVLNPADSSEVQTRLTLKRTEADVWEATSAAIAPGVHYALRASGPDGAQFYRQSRHPQLFTATLPDGPPVVQKDLQRPPQGDPANNQQALAQDQRHIVSG